MKSSIKIDFVDRGTGKGIEPVIRIELIKTDDPRDTLIQHLFESVGNQQFLQVIYSNHKPVLSSSGHPDLEKQILLFKPEHDTETIMAIFWSVMASWATERGWEMSVCNSDEKGTWYTKKDKPDTIREDELISQFIQDFKSK